MVMMLDLRIINVNYGAIFRKIYKYPMTISRVFQRKYQ